jgi:hypothetical protein
MSQEFWLQIRRLHHRLQANAKCPVRGPALCLRSWPIGRRFIASRKYIQQDEWFPLLRGRHSGRPQQRTSLAPVNPWLPPPAEMFCNKTEAANKGCLLPTFPRIRERCLSHNSLLRTQQSRRCSPRPRGHHGTTRLALLSSPSFVRSSGESAMILFPRKHVGLSRRLPMGVLAARRIFSMAS